MSDRPRSASRRSFSLPARLLSALGISALALTGCQEAPLPTEPDEASSQPDLAAAAQQAGPGADDWIVVFQPGTQDPPGLARKLAAENGGTVRFTYEHVLQGFAGRIPPAAIDGLRREELLDESGGLVDLISLDTNLGSVTQSIGDSRVRRITVVDEDGRNSGRFKRFLKGQRLNLVVGLVNVSCLHAATSIAQKGAPDNRARLRWRGATRPPYR